MIKSGTGINILTTQYVRLLNLCIAFVCGIVNVATYINTYNKLSSGPVELGMTEKQIQVVVGVALDPGPLDCESDAPTTRPRCLALPRSQ